MKTPNKPKKPNAQQARDEAVANARDRQMPADPFSKDNLRKMGMRLGIPVVIMWVIAIVLSGWIPKAIAGVITVALAGLVIWAVRYAQRTRAVANIVRDADTPEGRKQALSKLETDFKKDDTAALIAKAQLQIQEDPRTALKTLEQVNLDKVMGPTADEVRGQRAMIHLLLGETEEARLLVDKVDLTRQKETKSRATIAAIVGEAWARSGQAKKAVELLETFNPADEVYADLRPQLLRARAFAYAWASDSKQMKQTLRKLSALNPQYMAFFITKKKMPMGVNPRGVHPMLEKEAYDLVMRSGIAQRKMDVRRG